MDLDGKFGYVGVGEPSSSGIDSCPGSPASSTSTSSLNNVSDTCEARNPPLEQMSLNSDGKCAGRSSSSSDPQPMQASSDSECDQY